MRKYYFTFKINSNRLFRKIRNGTYMYTDIKPLYLDGNLYKLIIWEPDGF